MIDIGRDIRALVSEISNQPDGHRQNYTADILAALHRAELIPEVPHYWFEQQGEPIPRNWLAYEIAIFDNGDAPERDKRNRINTGKTKFAAMWKFHHGDVAHFNPRQSPTHEFVISFFDRNIAAEAIETITKKNGFGSKLQKASAALIENNLPDYVGVVRSKKKGKLAGYLEEFIAGLQMVDGKPSAIILFRLRNGELDVVEGSALAYEMANGEELTKNVVGVARCCSVSGELIDWVS